MSKITDDIRKKYYPTIGIECHVQLKTKTKLFASVDNDAKEAEPNTLISPLCVGHPGTLPVLNEAAVVLAIKAGLALKSTIAPFSKFDRKHYFYPDLPKGYQITQFDEPVLLGGQVTAPLDGGFITVNVTRAHLEEDAGKLTHPIGADYSLVDLNRAGTPLLEIVSEPEMHSAQEAKAYARELYLLMKYADVSECNLYYGNMRFDVNISVSSDPNKLGIRAEIKNLNSFKAVERAVEYEIDRQIALLESGEEVVQETRGWDDAKQKTFSQRSKEDAHDYRYFPEPDIPPLEISSDQIVSIKEKMPKMPKEIRESLESLSLDSTQIETIVENPELAAYIVSVIDAHGIKTAKTIANWCTGTLLMKVNEETLDWQTIIANAPKFIELVAMNDAGELSSTATKEVLVALFDTDQTARQIATDRNLIQVSDESEIESIVASVISQNPQAVNDLVNGELKAIGFLVGQVMKASKGKANPSLAQSLIKKQLNIV